MSSKSSKQISMFSGDETRDELDEHFLDRINELAECRLADWQSSKRLSPNVSRFCRLFWCYLGQYSQIDLYGGHQTYDDQANKWRWRHRENFDRRYSSVNRQRFWQPIIFVLYCYSSVRMLTNTICQYLYDISFIRLEVFRALTTHNNEADVSGQLLANANSRYIRYIESLLALRTAEEYGFLGVPFVNISNTLESGGWSSAASKLASIDEQLNARVTSLYTLMKRIGAPYIRLHFVVQVVYSFFFIATFIFVVLINIYYKRVKPFDYSLTRAFLDFKHERRLQNRLVLDEMNKFIVSSRNFTQNGFSQLKLNVKEDLTCQMQSEASKRANERLLPNSRLKSNRLLLDHIFIKRQLKQMALNGLILPLHRTPGWVERTSFLTVLLDLSAMVYAGLGALYFAFFFFIMSDTYRIEMSLIDISVIMEGAIQLAFIIPNAVFFIAQIVANCVDQILYSLNICRQIDQCIATNQHSFRQIIELQQCRSHFKLVQEAANPWTTVKRELHDRRLSRKLDLPLLRSTESELICVTSSVCSIGHSDWPKRQPDEMDGDEFCLYQGQGDNDNKGQCTPSMGLLKRSAMSRTLLIESHCTRMNSELLKVIMQYKVFVAQVKPLTKSFGTFATVLLTALIIMPLSIRLHSPYLNRNFKLYSVSFNLLCATIVNFCYIPMCYMYSRCIDLYARQSSLLAHVTEVANHQRTLAADQRSNSEENFFNNDLSEIQAYDSHTICLLRKELNHPHQMARQFAIHAFSIRLTYSSLLRLHFWVGIVTLSMLVESHSSQEFFGRLLNDPFGIFNWEPQFEGSQLKLSNFAAGQ